MRFASVSRALDTTDTAIGTTAANMIDDVWHCEQKENSADLYQCTMKHSDNSDENPTSSLSQTMHMTYKADRSLQRIDITDPHGSDMIMSLFNVPDKCLAVIATVDPGTHGEVRTEPCNIRSDSFFTIGRQGFRFSNPFATGAENQ